MVALSLLTLALIIRLQVSEIPPPFHLVLIYPWGVANIQPGAEIPLGVSGLLNDNETYWGLHRSANISVAYPNGADAHVITVGKLDKPECQIGPERETVGRACVDQKGSYSARWDITDGITTSTNQINEAEKNCGPEPLSTQNFTLEYTFEVRLARNGQTVPRYTREFQALSQNQFVQITATE
ncbi:hypothetical protein V5O48_001444 [Marasmius crinis-equi]|uniref:Uncharacterized protein n=1 Tax=Marasmius crinis-equi TaxID=585013 RepID=A0ABR3FYQ5_9AGAR